MATIFLDSFSHYTVAAGMPQKYGFLASSPILSPGGPSGGNYLAQGVAVKGLASPISACTFGCSLQINTIPSDTTHTFNMITMNGTTGFGTNNVYLGYVGSGGTLTLGYPGGQLSYTLTAAQINAWIYVECSISAFTAAATGIMKINGVQVATGTIVSNGFGTSTCQGLQVYAQAASSTSPNVWIADLYLTNAASPFLVPAGAAALSVTPQLPNAVGAASQWTRNGGTSAGNYTAVNPVPPNPGSQFVSDGTSGHKDEYGMQALPINTTSVVSVQELAYASNAAGGSVKLGYSNGSTDTFDSGHTTTATPAYIQRNDDTNPITSAAWTIADFATLQAGIQVT